MSEHLGLGSIDDVALRRYANRIISLRADRTAINADMGEVFKEAKDAGFVPEMIRGVVREMEMEPDARSTFFSTQDAYRRALGLLADTPLGAAAVERAARPKPFADQPIRRPRGRRKDRVDEALQTGTPHPEKRVWEDIAGSAE